MSIVRLLLNAWLTASLGWSLLTLWKLDVPGPTKLVALAALTGAALLTARWPRRFWAVVAAGAALVAAGLLARLPQLMPVMHWLDRLSLDYANTLGAWRSGDPTVPQGHVATVLLAVCVYSFSLLVAVSAHHPRRALTTAAVGGFILSVEWLVHHDQAVVAAAFFLPGALTLLAAARTAELTGSAVGDRVPTMPLATAPQAQTRRRGQTKVHIRIVALAVLAALVLTGAGLVLPSDYPTADLGVWRDRLQSRLPLLADLRGTALRRLALTFDLQQLGFGGSDDELGGPVRTNSAIALMLTVRGSDLPNSIYLRGRSPAYYTGRGWVPANEQVARTGLDAPPGRFSAAASQTALFADIQTQGLRTRTLFTILEPVRVQTTGDVQWLADHTALGSPAPGVGDTYSLTARQPLYSTDEIYELTAAPGHPLPAVPDEYLSVPVTLPPRIATLAADIAAGHEHPYDRIVAIEEYLRDFAYDLEAEQPPAGADFVDHFLFEQRSGYCVYHATAMTVMLRTLGIPARYVTGFRVDIFGEPGTYNVRNEMAHAWVEAYLPGYGWMTFEPTPAFPVPDRSYSADEVAVGGNETRDPVERDPAQLPTGPLPGFDDIDIGGSGGATAPVTSPAAIAWRAALFAVLAAAAAWVGLAIAAERGPSTATAGAPVAVFTLAARLFARSGLGGGPGLTATERIGRATRRWPILAEPLRKMLHLYLPSRYGSGAPAPREFTGAEAEAIDAWHEVRRGVRSQQGFVRYYGRLLRQRLPVFSLRRFSWRGRSAK